MKNSKQFQSIFEDILSSTSKVVKSAETQLKPIMADAEKALRTIEPKIKELVEEAEKMVEEFEPKDFKDVAAEEFAKATDAVFGGVKEITAVAKIPMDAKELQSPVIRAIVKCVHASIEGIELSRDAVLVLEANKVIVSRSSEFKFDAQVGDYYVVVNYKKRIIRVYA